MMSFEFDSVKGVIIDKVTGERCVITSEARMQESFSMLCLLLKSEAPSVIFKIGRAVGKRYINETPDEIKSDPVLFIDTYEQRFIDAGFGKMEIAEFNLEEARMTFRVYNNFFAEIRYEGKTYCDYIRGLVAGMYEQFLQKTPHVQVTKCIADGDPCCEWQITSK